MSHWKSRGEALADALAHGQAEGLAPELRETLLGLLGELELSELLLEARVEELAMVRELLATISYPLIEVREQVLCLPIVGPIDTQMMDRLTDATLRAVASRRTRFLIVDLTGAQIAEASAVDLLLRLCNSLRLLGAQAMLSGVGVSMAIMLTQREQTLAVPTHATLAAALAATERSTGART